MAAAETLGSEVGAARACQTPRVARATRYRQRARAPAPIVEAPARPVPPLKLTPKERDNALTVLYSERFVDASPHTIHATLLDEGQYPCSVRTHYRILAAEDELRGRRNLRRRLRYAKPELLPTEPNQLWSWDITKLKGPQKWTYFYLSVIIDAFTRRVVGWMVATCESAALAKQLMPRLAPNRASTPANSPCTPTAAPA